MKYLLLVLLLCSQAAVAGFQECFNHGTQGAEPSGAPRVYEIQKTSLGRSELKPVPSPLHPNTKVFRLIIEDVEFTTYKCWDKSKNLTGFDIELLTQILDKAGYDSIEFVPRVWSNYVIGEKKYLTLLVDLITGWGDAVSAGMSITPERRSLVTMIGPIYKAGKKLMGRKDNPLLVAKKSILLALPNGGYNALAGLSVLVQAGTIRADYFKELAKTQPHLVEFGQVVDGKLTSFGRPDQLFVLEVSSDILETFTKNQMNSDVFGKRFDLIMIDTGSTKSLISDGYLGRETEIFTGNLATDSTNGGVFGLGDGISFRNEDPRIPAFTEIIAALVKDGTVNHLVHKWFQDENAADHSWAN